MRQDFDSIRIVVAGAGDVGMVKAVREPREWQIVQIQLLPEYQGRGIGRQVIEDLQREARSSGVPLKLSVLKVNPAKRLYERLGFVVVQEKATSFEMCYE